jgi:hypothetical protein
MPYVPFREHFRDLAERETRTVTVPDDRDRELPAGRYAFVELDVLLNDGHYVDGLKRQYELFRERIEDARGHRAAQ